MISDNKDGPAPKRRCVPRNLLLTLFDYVMSRVLEQCPLSLRVAVVCELPAMKRALTSPCSKSASKLDLLPHSDIEHAPPPESLLSLARHFCWSLACAGDLRVMRLRAGIPETMTLRLLAAARDNCTGLQRARLQ